MGDLFQAFGEADLQCFLQLVRVFSKGTEATRGAELEQLIGELKVRKLQQIHPWAEQKF